VFSYKLSILHFWTLVFLYIWAGPHHLHYTALPDWASTFGMVFSIMLWMPSWGGMVNGLLTLRGAWNKVTDDPILKFFVVGVTAYGMSTFEGPMLSIKSVNALAHYTDWIIAHVHTGALGWNGFITFGMIYWLLPRLFQTKGVYSKKLMEMHFWIATFGILLYVVAIYSAGVTQGLMWRAFDETGRLAFPDFVETTLRLRKKYPNIIGIKEAGGQVEKAARLVREADPEFIVLSGDDSLTLPFAEVGAQGIISVASNLIPGPVAKLAKLARTKQFAEAKVLHDQLAEIFKTLFVEPNPVPVKHCMMRAGLIRSDEVRLPLCEMSAANRLLVEQVADATLASLR